MKAFVLSLVAFSVMVSSSFSGTIDSMMREKILDSAISSTRYPPQIGFGIKEEESRKSTPLALFMSAVVPGAGEYYLGSTGRAKVLIGVEVVTWASYIAFTYHGRRVRDTYKLLASARAGALMGVDSETYWNAIEWNATNEDYNEKVREEARALYPDDIEKQQQYIEDNIFEGDLAWSWESGAAIEEYRRLRRESRDAFQYAVYTTGFALLNRLVSLMDVIVTTRWGEKKVPFGNRVQLKVEPGEETASWKLGFLVKVKI